MPRAKLELVRVGGKHDLSIDLSTFFGHDLPLHLPTSTLFALTLLYVYGNYYDDAILQPRRSHQYYIRRTLCLIVTMPVNFDRYTRSQVHQDAERQGSVRSL